VTNLSFDLSVYDIFGILAAGATVRIVNDEDRLDPRKQFDIMLSEGITFWDTAPQSLQQITPFFKNGGNDPQYNSLRLVFLSGDWIPLTLPGAVTSNFPSAVVVGLGGATEATIWSNYFIIGEIKPEWKSVPYGKPVQNARYYVLDDNFRHCRIRKPGNLYIGGECLALGYFNDPELTNSKFIQDPFNPDSKLYRTGDKAQWMSDGNIEFLGRDDGQVKIRGYRVELGEIKNAVLNNKAIREAVIVPDKSDLHNIQVILFILTHNDIKPDIKDLRRELRLSLPEYMIPIDIIHYKEFPVTSNGKINTKVLLSDYLRLRSENKLETLREKTEEKVEAHTPTQKAIHKVWSDVLKADGVSIKDDFFDSGGNSLLGIRLINQIKEELGVTLTFRNLLGNSTIEKLGLLIDSQNGRKGEVIKLVHLTETKHLPLTRNQKRIWIISRLQPDDPLYIIPSTFKFTGSLNLDVFERSINILFQRHHIVFSVINESEGEPYCDIVQTEVRIPLIDYSGLSEEEKMARVKEIMESDTRKVFDLRHGPLYRLYLIKTSTDEYYFHISIHHIIFDGWSKGVLTNDLSTIYNSLLKDKKIELEDLEFQQYDFAQWETVTSDPDHTKDSAAFWEENLKGCSPVLNFPYDFPRKGNSKGGGSFETLQLTKNLSDILRDISKEEGASLFTALMAAFGVQMHIYSSEDDLNIGLPVVYRPHSKLENIIGMFVNTVVVRLKYEKGTTFRTLIRQSNDAAMNAIAHQDLPFENVVEIVNPDRSSNANPLFQVALAWQNDLEAPINLDGVVSESVTGSIRAAIFDILIFMREDGDIIKGEIDFSTDLLKQETMRRFRDNLVNTIRKLAENPDSPIESLPMISEEEKILVESFNNTQTPYPSDKTIVQLFEEQVKLYPEKTAIVFQESFLTYQQLNEKANQLARTLRDSGVTGNTPVAILADKSLDVIAGTLAILKAGGGYVPIDPEYPDQRKSYMINDAGCKVLLIQDKYNNITFEGVRNISLNSPDSYYQDKSDIEGINTSSDLAYIMYTSGTTGKPKGSLILQYSVVRLVRNMNYVELTPEDRILLTGAIVFDATTFEIWGALLNGGTLHIVEKETILDPKLLGEELIKNDITILWITSSLFTQIAEMRTDIFRKLKYLLSGGDVPSAPHINKVRKDNPDLKFIHCYGPTENTTFSTTYIVDRDYDNYIPIGKPISNSTAYIFDRYMNYQAIGVVGELYVGGDGLSGGYLNRDDLNSTKFIDNPHKPGERLYRTGDYARWLPDGNIEFRGRIDNQLKIRGFRVELEEIESILSEIDGVIETVIKPVKVEEGDYRLVAFLNVPENFTMETKEILAQIRAKLPGYMIPSAFKFLHGFQKNVNGKTDRKALTFDTRELGKRENIDPGSLSPTESRIHKIWCDALKTEDVSGTDNFFEIGGNSLLAISIMSKIESEFNVELGLKAFFDSPVISDLAETIDIRLRQTSKKTNDAKENIPDSKIVIGEI
jgi:amino acid adenylation domain-containing protein